MRNTSTLRVLVAFATAASVACNADDITKVNENPNSPTDAPASAVFTNGVLGGVSRFLGWGYNGRATELIAQHLAQAQYPDEDTYRRIDASSTRGFFDGPYTAELEDLQKVADAGTASKNSAIYGPALAMQSLVFEYLTDTWGDIPYSEALKGDAKDGVLLPKYDPQKDVYAGLLATLTKVATDLGTPGNGTLGVADPIYGGEPAAWQRFANTLHARLALRLINVDPATAASELQKALNGPGGVFRSNEDNAVVSWPGDGVFNNDWSTNFETRDDHRLSRTLMNAMLVNKDPRIPIYAQPTTCFTTPSSCPAGAVPQEYAGMPNGLRADSANKWLNIASRVGPGFFPGKTAYGIFGGGGGARPTFVLSYAELQFIRAEAAERGIAGLSAGQAAGFYRSGITASLEQWGVTDGSAITTFLAQPGVAYKGGVEGLKQIAVQKWIALYTDGGQAWAEWRRTCQPSTIAPGPSANPQYVPRRLFYSTTEISANGDNLKAAIARQGPDNFGTRIYWDTKPTAAPTCQ